MPTQLPSISEISWPYRFLAIAAAVQLIPSLWRYYRRKRAETWPITDGQINTARVADIGESFNPRKPVRLDTFTRNEDDTYDAELTFSYTVGKSFTGRYKRSFSSEEDAREFVRDLQGKPIVVHYNPGRPSVSMVFDSDIESIQLSRGPAPDLPIVSNGLPGWAVPLLWPLIVLSAAGFGISLWVNISALSGRVVLPDEYFFAMHAGIFVVFIPAILMVKALPRQPRSTSSVFQRSSTYFPAPPVLQMLLPIVFFYAIFNFIVAFGLDASNTYPSDLREARGFSGHWMLFYFASMTMLFAARGSAKHGSGIGLR